MADAVIAKSAACQRALLADGYAANRIERIDHGFAAGQCVGRIASRGTQSALALVNSDLVDAWRFAGCDLQSRMTRESGVNLLGQSGPAFDRAISRSAAVVHR